MIVLHGFFAATPEFIQRSDTCELTNCEPLKTAKYPLRGAINVNCPLKDIYNEPMRLNVISCGTGGKEGFILDLRNVDLELYDFTDKHMANTILNL